MTVHAPACVQSTAKQPRCLQKQLGFWDRHQNLKFMEVFDLILVWRFRKACFDY